MRKVIALILLLGLLLPATLAVVFEQYPVTLAKSGRFNTLIVIGEDAAIKDSLAAVGLGEALQDYFDVIAEEAKQRVEDEIARYQQEDVYDFDDLQIDECLGEDNDVITSGGLSALLRGGTLQTRDRTEYDQYLRFGDSDSDDLGCVKVVFDRNEEDELDTFLYAEDGEVLFEYELSFGSGLTSRVRDDNTLRDLIDEELDILGRPYRIIGATENGNKVDLRLMQGEMQDTLQEGQTQTYTIGGVPYHVQVLIVSDNANGGNGGVKFRVNGQVTSLLADGETETLSDGTIIGVRNVIPNEAGETYSGGVGEVYDPEQYEDIDYGQYEGLSPAELEAVLGQEYAVQDQAYAGGGDVVEFYIGAHILRLEDRANDETFERGVSVNFDTVKNGQVQIRGDTVDDEYKIYSIKYRLEAESVDGDDIYVPSEKGIREFLNSPGDLLSPVWDIRFGGLGSSANDDELGSTVTFRPTNGDQGYDIQFTNSRGDDYRIPFVNTEGSFKLGDDNEDFFFKECTSTSDFCIPTDSYVVLTDRNTHKGLTHIVQYTDINTGSNSITFQDAGSGDQQTKTYSGTPGTDAEVDMIFGGNTYKVYIGGAGDNYNVAVDMNKDGDVNEDEMNIVVQGGGLLDLGSTNTPAGDFDVSLTTEASEIEGSSSDEVVTWSIEERGDDLGIALVDQADLTLESEGGDEVGVTDFGVRFTLEDASAGEKLIITYPGGQSNADVSIIASESLAPDDASAEGLFTFEGINVGTFHLDSEIEDVYQENLLVVGGPCANKVTKELLGDYEPCTAGFEEGKAILRIFNLPESFSIVVAGFTSEDTQKAVEVLKNFEDYPFLTDTFLEISGPLDNLKFRQVTAQEWQDRVDFDRIKDRAEEVEDVNESVNVTAEPIITPDELVEEQLPLEEVGLEEDLSLQTNQNIMLIIGIFIFVAVILLISYMSYKHHQEEEAEEEDKQNKRSVPAVKFKNVPEEEDDDEDEIEEGRKAAAVPKKKDKKVVKEEKKKKKQAEKERKAQEKKQAKETKTKKAEEKTKEKKQKKKGKTKKPDVEEVVDLDSLEQELMQGIERHKKG